MPPPRSADASRRVLAAVRALLGASVALTLVVAAALALFAHPNGDDFCLGADVREVGALGCVERAYSLQGGRWAGYALGCGVKAAVELTKEYPLGPLLVLGAFVAAVGFLVTSVLRLGGDRRLAGSLCAVLLALYWAGMPHPGQSFYWLDGSIVYCLNFALSMTLVGGLLRLPARPSPGRSAAVAGLSVLALVTAAFHELFALVLGLVLAAGAALAFLRRDPRRFAWAAAAAAVAIGFATVAVAPGNAHRERGVVAHVQGVGGAVRETVEMWLRVLDSPVQRGTNPGSHGSPLGWVVDARLLAATVLFATSARVRSWRPAWLLEDLRRWQVIVPTVWLLAITGTFLGGGWLLGTTLPARVFNGVYLIFLLGWFLTVFVYTRWEVAAGSPPGERALRLAGAAILALGLLVSTNVKHGVRDLVTGRAAAFDRELDARYAAARELRARGGGALVVPPIVPWPASYYENDVVADPEAPQNQCVARYFELESIRLGSPRDAGVEPLPSDASDPSHPGRGKRSAAARNGSRSS